jgi:hypothetical protein
MSTAYNIWCFSMRSRVDSVADIRRLDGFEQLVSADETGDTFCQSVMNSAVHIAVRLSN